MRTFLFSFLALIASVSATPKFLPADDSYPLLRRDLVPLDVDSIRELATQLAILGDGPLPAEAEKLRDKAKALTLSQRLAPTEPRARAASEAYLNQETRPAPSKEELEGAQKTTLLAAQWLIDLPAETEGHRLGQLLLDILAPIVPGNPMTQRRDKDGEAARWRGVIAKPSDFAGKPKITPVRPLTPDPQGTPTPPVVAQSYQTKALLTGVPMLCKDIPQTSPIEPALIKTSLVITEQKGDDPAALKFQPAPDFDLVPLHRDLRNFFKSSGRPLPGPFNLTVKTDSRQYVASNRENIAAPIAMMLDAALTGRPLRRNTHLFAHLNADGSLGRPAKAWEILLHLLQTKAPPATRLIVGPGLDEELNALLVIQQSGFFVDFEVIAAPTFEAARQLFYEDGKPADDLATAIAGYQEVREKALIANSLATFLNLTAVENRLAKARDASPLHLSARILATQTIRRPDSLSRFMLAQEMDRRIQPLLDFKYDENATTTRQIKTLFQESRESIQALEKLTNRHEEALLKEALGIIQELHRIARSSNDPIATSAAMLKFSETISSFRKKLRALYETS
ncbi:hypothetical protein V2O64_10545 [Verrucomicrobiaceae bacterium 227]